MRVARLIIPWIAFAAASAQRTDRAAPPASVGTVRFATSCSAAAQPGFDRAVALLHSFEFSEATRTFNAVLAEDPSLRDRRLGPRAERLGQSGRRRVKLRRADPARTRGRHPRAASGEADAA